MVYNIKRMDMFRVVVDEMNLESISSAIQETLQLSTPSDDETILSGGNIESMPIVEQVECVLSAHNDNWPQVQSVYYSKHDGQRLKMEIAWFRIIKKCEGCGCECSQ